MHAAQAQRRPRASHHEMVHRVTSWPQCEAGLRSRVSLALRITSEGLAQWQAARRTTPGAQPRYSDLAIEMAPMLSCRRCRFDQNAEDRMPCQIGSRIVDRK